MDPGIFILTSTPGDFDSSGPQIHFEQYVSTVEIVSNIQDKTLTMQIIFEPKLMLG